MDAIDLLRGLQLALFIMLAVVAGAMWWRRRLQPARYLALAFVTLAVAVTVSRLLPDVAGVGGRIQTSVVLTGLLAFPWLLACMTWSFEGELPRWLRWAGGGVAVHALLVLGFEVLPAADEPSVSQAVYVAGFVAAWTLMSIAAASKLWRSGGGERLIRQRMRLMAAGLLLLNIALLLAGMNVGGDLAGMPETTTLLAVVAAGAFVAGFAAPPALRVWWRRRSTQQFQRMQAALIGAVTPDEVAGAVAPLLADLVGGGVAVIGRDGEVAAAADMDAEHLARDRARLLAGEPPPASVQVIDVAGYWLLVRSTAYTPVFGQGEQQIVQGLALQLQLALERAELFQAHLEARAAAEAASQELEATLMGLSHDLKSPTAAIVGFAELLRHSDDPAELGELVEQIRTSTGYLEDLVDALLEFSKVGRAQVEVEPVDLGATVRAVSARIAATAPRLAVAVRDELPVVLVNPVRAEQVVDNLLGNAVKHGGRDDLTVTVTARTDDDGAVVGFHDDGKGFEGADTDRLFALFARGERAGSSGSGVGLGMVRRIVESYGGSVEVAAVSTGASIEVRWPTSVVVDRPAREHEDSANGSVAGRSTTK